MSPEEQGRRITHEPFVPDETVVRRVAPTQTREDIAAQQLFEESIQLSVEAIRELERERPGQPLHNDDVNQRAQVIKGRPRPRVDIEPRNR